MHWQSKKVELLKLNYGSLIGAEANIQGESLWALYLIPIEVAL